jgi:hypothetical protein
LDNIRALVLRESYIPIEYSNRHSGTKSPIRICPLFRSFMQPYYILLDFFDQLELWVKHLASAAQVRW